ncbi:hypothetical protein Ms3S1_13230 [Methylosinus sp. 3S-1]
MRHALARAAYGRREIRVADPVVAGHDCLISTRLGLFAGRREGVKRLLWGYFFGVARHEDAIYLFEACDDPAGSSDMGRILRFHLHDGRLSDFVVLAEGLHNQCHQIAVIDDLLCVVDTARQSIVRLRLDGGLHDIRQPIEVGPRPGGGGAYRHINSIAEVGERIALMLHNGPVLPEEPSELAWLDRDFNLLSRQPLPGRHCHDILPLPDGSIWHCGSFAGEIIDANGARIKISERMTRGLIAVPGGFIVGASLFGPRSDRDILSGSIIYLDRSFRRLVEAPCPGAPTDLLALCRSSPMV